MLLTRRLRGWLLSELRRDILALKVDLTNRQEYTAAADKVEEVFGGPPHLLIQTAGVNSFGPIEASHLDDFDWVMGVCQHHVVNGLLIFVPRMIKAYANRRSSMWPQPPPRRF
jgi:NADP-dependent 3-hydroxy acid dehydrogenase YdfG